MSQTEPNQTLRIQPEKAMFGFSLTSGVSALRDVSPYLFFVANNHVVSVYVKGLIGKPKPGESAWDLTKETAKWWRSTDLQYIRFAFKGTKEGGVRFNIYSTMSPSGKGFKNITPSPRFAWMPAEGYAPLFKFLETARIHHNLSSVTGFSEDTFSPDKSVTALTESMQRYLRLLAYPVLAEPGVEHLHNTVNKTVRSAYFWNQALRARSVEEFLNTLLGKRKVSPQLVEATSKGLIHGNALIKAWSFAQRDPAKVIQDVAFTGMLPYEASSLSNFFVNGYSSNQVLARISSDSFLRELAASEAKDTFFSVFKRSEELVSEAASLFKTFPKRSVNSVDELSAAVAAMKKQHLPETSMRESAAAAEAVLKERGYAYSYSQGNGKGGVLSFKSPSGEWKVELALSMSSVFSRSDNPPPVVSSFNLLWNDGKRRTNLRSDIVDRFKKTLPMAQQKAMTKHDVLEISAVDALNTFFGMLSEIRERLGAVRTNVTRQQVDKAFIYAVGQGMPSASRVYKRISRMLSLDFTVEQIQKMQRYRVPLGEIIVAATLPQELFDSLYVSKNDYEF